MGQFLAKDDTFVEEPADKLYNEGLYLMNQRKDPKAASKKFEEVDRPASLFRLGAQIAADVGLFLLSGRRLRQLHRRRDALCHAASRQPGRGLRAISDRGVALRPDPGYFRDQGRTEKAIASLEEVVRKYPTSEYANTAKAKLEGARDQLAGKEMAVGRYYMEKRDFTAAINRFKTVVTQYQTTRHVEEALARLTEAYMAIGITGEAQTAAAVLGHNFPTANGTRTPII